MEEKPGKLETMRSEAEEIFRRCLRAVDPFEAVKGFIHVEGDRLILGTKGHLLICIKSARNRPYIGV